LKDRLAAEIRSWFTYLLPGVLILACAGAQRAHRTDLPPRELLQANLAHATYVLEVEVLSLESTATFRDDSGAIGYVQFTVIARPTRVIKGDVDPEPALSYRFTVEYDSASKPPVAAGKRYVVFLKRVESGQLWLFSEAAQFPSTVFLLRELGVD
jgi:hypothetical protein